MNVLSFPKHTLLLVTLLTLTESAVSQSRSLQSVPNTTVQAAFRNIAEVKNLELIELILDDFLIPESINEIDKIEIFDVSNVGFGSQNVLIVYPSRNLYVIERPSSDELVKVMQSWRLQDQRRDADNSLLAEYFYPGDRDSALSEKAFADGAITLQDENELAVNALISDLLSSLSRNYQDTTISLRFERDKEGFTFQVWGYNGEALVYQERPVIPPDTVTLKEVITEVIRDTVIVEKVIESEGIDHDAERLDNRTVDLSNGDLATNSKSDKKNLTKFNFSLLNAFLDYNPVSEIPFDTVFSYDPGFGVEVGYSIEPRIVYFSLGVGGMYHLGKSFETAAESGPFRDPKQTVIRSFNGFHLYGTSSTGLDFIVKNRFNIKVLYTIKYGIYHSVKDKFNYEPEPTLSTFIGMDAGLLNPDISFFLRQSLVTRMNIDSILEYGVTLSF